MIDQALRQRIEQALVEVAALGIKPSFSKWNKYTDKTGHVCLFKQGSAFLSRKGTKENYNIDACCPMGSIIFLDHKQKMGALPEEERTLITSVGWSVAASILGVDYDWVHGFTSGWDLSYGCKTYWNEESHLFGIELRSKYPIGEEDKYVAI